MVKYKIHFNNLNGLRFFAALMVIICHIEQNKKAFLLPNLRSFLKHLGVLGVDLFFVLSGFLITILLLKEKEIYGKIDYKKFYLRRILRIWPLYYFVVILSLLVLPNIPFLCDGCLHFFGTNELLKVIVLFVLMLPNVLIFIKIIPFAAQTWSIGTEEQFYVVWPFIINNFRNLKRVFLGCIIGYWIIYSCITLNIFDKVPYFELFRNYYNLLKVDVLSIGALGALLMYEKDKVINIINNLFVFCFSFGLLFLFYILITNPYEVFRVIYAILFMVIILNLVGNKKIETIFENKILNYLGQISYGIYMYHNIFIFIVLKMVVNNFKQFQILENIIVYIGSIVATIIVSHISYQYFEKPILRYKAKFSPFSNDK